MVAPLDGSGSVGILIFSHVLADQLKQTLGSEAQYKDATEINAGVYFGPLNALI